MHLRAIRWGGFPVCALLCLLVLPCFSLSLSAADFTRQELAGVITTLAEQGHPRFYLEQLFGSAQLRRRKAVVGFNTMNRERGRDYSDFLKPYSLRLARRFMARHQALLSRVEGELGVPAQVLVALLQIETQFGKAREPFKVLEVYTTLAVESDPGALERYYIRLKKDHPQLEREWLAQRLAAKRTFAFEQLSALMRMGLERELNILSLRGSYAGAFGMPQFLPTSYLRWGRDGDGDGVVALEGTADALYSAANYLKAHGWGEAPQEQRQALWAYNRSPPYVEAILSLADALRGKIKAELKQSQSRAQNTEWRLVCLQGAQGGAGLICGRNIF